MLLCYSAFRSARAIGAQRRMDEIVDDEVGQEQVVETPEVQTPDPTSSHSQEQSPSSDGHPAWAPIREAVGDLLFAKIQPNLKEFDAQANKRVTDVNSKYDAWKGFDTDGVSPDHVRRALGIVQGIDANPLQMYQALEAHLRQQGLLQAQVQAPEQQTGEEEEELDPRDQALSDLQAQQEQMVAFLQAQQEAAQQAEYTRQADAALDKELSDLRTARPGTTREEEQAFLQRLSLHLRAGDHGMTLAKIAETFDADRSRILSQPRPNDFAPRIPGAGGSAPTGNPQQKTPAEYSREESQAYLADLIRKANK